MVLSHHAFSYIRGFPFTILASLSGNAGRTFHIGRTIGSRPSAPDTIPGPVHPARPVRLTIGPWPINHARLSVDTGPWPSGHARPPLDTGHPATPVRPDTAWILDSSPPGCLFCRHDDPGQWARLFLPSAETFSPTRLISDQLTGGGDDQFTPGCFLQSDRPTGGCDIQSPPGYISDRPTGGGDVQYPQVLRPTCARRPRIQYRALANQPRPSARLLGPGIPPRPPARILGPGHPAMPVRPWILGPGHPAMPVRPDTARIWVRGCPARLSLLSARARLFLPSA
jgi:hypothetical protein